MTKRPTFGIFQHNEREFVGWLLMLSPVPVCAGTKFKQASGFSACCQLHAVTDCLEHAEDDNMSAEDRITCIIASEYLQQGKGVAATGKYTLPPNHGIEHETEN